MIVLIVITHCKNSKRYVMTHEVESIENSPSKSESRSESRSVPNLDSREENQSDLIKVPRSRIIRQPFPVGEPANPFYNKISLTQEDLYIRYGGLLPFSNPPPPNGPAFAGGYGPPETPVPTGYMAPDETLERVFPEFTGAGGFRR